MTPEQVLVRTRLVEVLTFAAGLVLVGSMVVGFLQVRAAEGPPWLHGWLEAVVELTLLPFLFVVVAAILILLAGYRSRRTAVWRARCRPRRS